jgi:hypothetical protein
LKREVNPFPPGPESPNWSIPREILFSPQPAMGQMCTQLRCIALIMGSLWSY